MNAAAHARADGCARVEVLLFGPLAERAGARRVHLVVDGNATVGDLSALLDAQAPRVAEAVAALAGRVAVSRNERYAAAHERLEDGDVLALIPPVSGG